MQLGFRNCYFENILNLKSIEFDYELQRHQKAINGLSINKQDSEFVSTGYDQKLLFGKKPKMDFNQLIILMLVVEFPILQTQ
ncbi:unnamed protein product [Paramecium primaurelia]|uniref:Uncharacterized protein n=1 Tax=Paramecium primaurelia TaxID=5886 RepID=A0A8S1PQ28_PARPR|nr:unnamed protein product [Paramecium primaurelia]